MLQHKLYLNYSPPGVRKLTGMLWNTAETVFAAGVDRCGKSALKQFAVHRAVNRRWGKMENRLLEMKIDTGYEDHFERRDGEEVVIVFVARTKKN